MANRTPRHSAGASVSSSTPSAGVTALDELMDELQVEPGAVSEPAPLRPAGCLRRDGAPAGLLPSASRAPPPPPVLPVPAPGSAVSAASSSWGVSGRIRGHLEEEWPLLSFGGENNLSVFCRGYIGGRQGNRSRFCFVKVEGFMAFCCEGHKGDKFPLVKSMLYIEMKDNTALCEPCISRDQLSLAGSSHLLAERHSSRVWSDLVGTALVLAISTSPVMSETGLEDKSHSLGESASASLDFASEVSPHCKPAVGVGTVEVLKSTGIEALKSLLPASSLLFGRPKPSDAEGAPKSATEEETVEFDAAAPPSTDDRWDALSAVVLSLYDTLPSGLQEVDSKFTKAVQAMERRQSDFATSLETVQRDLFGSEDPDDIIGSQFRSFGRGLLDLATSVDGLTSKVGAVERVADSIQDAVNPIVVRMDDAEADIDTLNLELAEANSKMDTMADKMAASIRLVMLKVKSSAGATLASTSSPAMDDSGFYAAYYDYTDNRPTIARGTREYDRLTRNGFILVATFKIWEEAEAWLAAGGVPPSRTEATAPEADPVDTNRSQPGSSELSALRSELEHLQRELEDIRATTIGKGVAVGSYSFDSEDDLVELLKSEQVVVNEALPCALDAMSFWSHRLTGVAPSSSQSTQKKLMMEAGVSDNTSMVYIESFRREQPEFFLGNKDSSHLVPEGERFPILESTKVWEGTTAISGYRRQYEKAVQSGNQTALKYIQQHTPTRSRFRELCLHLLQETNSWLGHMEQHINNELKRVQQYGIPEARAYTLVSDEVNIIFKAIWNKRQLMQEFSKGMDLTVYLARAVWTTMEAHMVMKEFSDAGFGVHTQISSLFTRFLAEETGSNFSSGLASTITELKTSISAVQSSVDSKAKAISKRCDSLTDNVKRLCNKTDVSYKAQG